MTTLKDELYDELRDLIEAVEEIKQRDHLGGKFYSKLLYDLEKTLSNEEIDHLAIDQFHCLLFNLTNLMLDKFCINSRNKIFKLIIEGDDVVGISVFHNLFDEGELILFPNMTTKDLERIINYKTIQSPFVKGTENRFYDKENVYSIIKDYSYEKWKTNL